MPAPGRGAHGVPTRQALKEKQQLGASDGITSASPLLSHWEAGTPQPPAFRPCHSPALLWPFFYFLVWLYHALVYFLFRKECYKETSNLRMKKKKKKFPKLKLYSLSRKENSWAGPFIFPPSFSKNRSFRSLKLYTKQRLQTYPLGYSSHQIYFWKAA